MAENQIAAITGSTKLVAIVGDPIEQVGSPRIFNPRLQRLKSNAVLVPMHIPQARFEEAMRGLMRVANLPGIVITVPFKQRAAALVDRIGHTGRQVGGINAMRQEPDGTWSGDMFDGMGLVRAISLSGRKVNGSRILLLGAGGAGSAIALAFAEAGAQSLTLFDPDEQRATALAQRVQTSSPSCAISRGQPVAAGHDIVVNASPVGMHPRDGLPAPLGPLNPETLIVDIIPKPEITPLIATARASGCATVGGLAMIDAQADKILEFFRLAA